MKKFFLLIATLGISATSIAQSAKVNSLVFTQREVTNEGIAKTPSTNEFVPLRNYSNKATAPGGSWFDYVNIMFKTGTTRGWYYTLYNDSNVVTTGTSGNFFSKTHGMGTSFDPTDSIYFGGDVNGQTSAGSVASFTALPTFRVTAGNAYIIDTIDFLGRYARTQNYTDTLVVQVVKTVASGGFGSYRLRYTTPSTDFYKITPTGMPGFSTAIFNPATNQLSDSITAANRVRMTRILDAAYFADSSTNGYHDCKFALPSPMNVEAGEKVVIYVTFRSGNAYPLNTNVTAANTFRTHSYEIDGANKDPKQNVNSTQCGLVATFQSKYVPPYTPFLYQGHNVLIPTFLYDADAGSDAPYFSAYVRCPSCPTLNVANINRDLTGVSAYPNPANTDVTITYSLKNTAKANISITNTVGQVVASKEASATANGKVVISTANLTNGIYFYTVEANGERVTNRFVVAH